MNQEPHHEVMKYLRNITQKLIRLDEKIVRMEQNMKSLGRCNSEAFKMCRTCIQTLAENQEEVSDQLAESAGVIQECTWA